MKGKASAFFVTLAVALFTSIILISISLHDCQADDKEDVLKKAGGSYQLERKGPRGEVTLNDRTITFSATESCLAVVENCSGQPERRSRIPLSEISKDKDGSLAFGYNFLGDISTSKIKVSPGGNVSGWSGRAGRIAEIEFRKK